VGRWGGGGKAVGSIGWLIGASVDRSNQSSIRPIFTHLLALELPELAAEVAEPHSEEALEPGDEERGRDGQLRVGHEHLGESKGVESGLGLD
jgi:hypothetical protein